MTKLRYAFILNLLLRGRVSAIGASSAAGGRLPILYLRYFGSLDCMFMYLLLVGIQQRVRQNASCVGATLAGYMRTCALEGEAFIVYALDFHFET
jgi:hypothetical protein